jgi:hypothetical protein
MQQPVGHHLAELNLGILKYDWDDPRVQDFVNGLDRVNGAAKRSKGFVWMMDPDEMAFEQTSDQGNMGANPRMASTLSVWEDVASLEHFVWNTVHKKFYDRKAEWYDMGAVLRFAMWWVPVGHRPTMAEAMARFRHLEKHGASVRAFGWDAVKEAQLWKTKACG